MKLNDLPPVSANPSALAQVVRKSYPEIGRHGDGAYSLVQDIAEQKCRDDFLDAKPCVLAWLADDKQHHDIQSLVCAAIWGDVCAVGEATRRLEDKYVYEHGDKEDYINRALESMTDERDETR